MKTTRIRGAQTRDNRKQGAGGRKLLLMLPALCSLLLVTCANPSESKPLSSDAALESLQAEGMLELVPPFDLETTDYTALVGNSTTSLVINARPRSSEATVSGTGNLGALEVGERSLKITVTAQDGAAQRTYALLVVRLDSQGFGPAEEPPFLVPGPGEAQLTVQWNAVWGAESYEVLYGIGEDMGEAQSFVLEAGSLSYSIEGITRGMDCYVWVKARKGDAVKVLPRASASVPAAFGSFEALAAFLGSAPQNTVAAPYFIAMSGLTTADLNKTINGVDVSLGALFSALQGRYAAVDLQGLTGPVIPSVSIRAETDRDKLTALILPDTLEDLGTDVFRDCPNLVSVGFGGNLISIGDRAFQSSGLKTLDLPDSLQIIGNRAFEGTALETLELSPGLTSIKDRAFSIPSLRVIDFRSGAPGAEGLRIEGGFADSPALVSVRLPDNLDSLVSGYSNEDTPFYNCPALEILSIPATTNDVNRSTARQSKTIRFETRGTGKFGTALEGMVLTQLGGAVWITAPGLGGGEIEVPEGVIEILESFFSGKGITGITLPSTLTVINRNLFSHCSALERVTIKGAVTFIGDSAFLACSALGSIELPESLRHIGWRAFYLSGLRRITVPSMVETYGVGASVDDVRIFDGCASLEYADIRTPHLAPAMFRYCEELKELALAPETKEIPRDVLYNCRKLEKINPGGGRNINLPPGLETIKTGAFAGCSALGGELELPTTLRVLEGSALTRCSGITGLILPRSLDLNPNALAGLESIDSLSLNGTGDSLRVSPEGKLLIKGDAVILTLKTLGDVTIPAGVRDYTKLAGNTSLTGLVFEEDSGRTSVPQNAFKGCANLVRVALSGNIQILNASSFDDCAALEELVIANASTLTYPVDRTVFRNCVSLTSIKVPPALVDDYKVHARWRIRPPGVVGSPYLSEYITGNM